MTYLSQVYRNGVQRPLWSGLPRWLACAVLAGSAASAAAQGYPAKTLRIVVPYPPGGPVDMTARLMGQKFTDSSGQSVIVDNRSGASTIIGTELVVKSPPDGYTVLLNTSSIAINPSLYDKLPYDTLRDLIAVTEVTTQPFILVANPSTQFRTVKELIAAAKSKPGSIRCASAGVGGPNHLACELLNKMANIKITHVSYKGAAPALVDTLSGQVEIYMPNPVTTIKYIQAGKLQALAVTGTKRIGILPDLPTVAEAGLPGYDANVWMGMFVSAGTAPDMVRRIQQESARVLKLPEVQKALTSEGGEIIASTPEQFAAYMKAEIQKWREIVIFSGAKAE